MCAARLTALGNAEKRQLATAEEREEARKQRDNLTQLPRYLVWDLVVCSVWTDEAQFFSNGFVLAPASSRFRGGDVTTGECNWPVYVEGALLTAGLALVVAGIALLFCPVFWLLRCCGCCGGCTRSYGTLCPGEPRDTVDDEYSPRSVWMTRCGLFVTAGALLISFAIAQVGSNTLSTGIVDYANATRVEIESTIADFDNALTQLDALAMRAQMLPGVEFNASAFTAIDRSRLDGSALIDAVERVGDAALSFDSSRASVQLVAGLVSLAIVFVALLGAACRLPKLALVLGIFGFFAFAFAWTSFALNYSFGACLIFVVFVAHGLCSGDHCRLLHRSRKHVGKRRQQQSRNRRLSRLRRTARLGRVAQSNFQTTQSHVRRDLRQRARVVRRLVGPFATAVFQQSFAPMRRRSVCSAGS